MTKSPLAPHTSSPVELKERFDADERGRPHLVYRDGGGNQRIFDLGEAPDEVRIGRRPANDIALGWDLEVSRLHAQLERMGDDWTVIDEGLSHNGTFVNGERVIGRRRLVNGDTVRVGNTVMAFVSSPGTGSQTTLDQEELPTAASITDAQRRVLLALCRPYKEGGGFAAPASNREIAEELVISVDGVKTHLRALFYVFGVTHLPQNQKRARLAERAFHTGVVSVRDL